VNPFGDLISTLEVVRDAVDAKQKPQAFEAVTVLLLQYVEVFGHSQSLMMTTFPLLEQLKNHICSEEYDAAYPIILALLAKFRRASQAF
jgi:hypothetical protein